MSKHTPGPWTVHDNIGRNGELGIVADAAPCIIAVMGNQKAWPEEARGNAEFIVRACNAHDGLLAAMDQTADLAQGVLDSLKWLEEIGSGGPIHSARGYAIAVIAAATAAIRKAKGGDA